MKGEIKETAEDRKHKGQNYPRQDRHTLGAVQNDMDDDGGGKPPHAHSDQGHPRPCHHQKDQGGDLQKDHKDHGNTPPKQLCDSSFFLHITPALLFFNFILAEYYKLKVNRVYYFKKQSPRLSDFGLTFLIFFSTILIW